ncbi:anti-sigma B factor antagonist [Scopulibacillus daqui]|uniref:Anti-sigma factor antagonist n=1 Tax=Scopulibacillus daqui TaxID=1469162 RepID=A0ABS2PXB9_9BACL|nr:STAS domain-containing protein [Scopulibacillus daqui]MBM7644679.1 anti-sigma B factor antagonist [Scopulibacillus daqui]
MNLRIVHEEVGSNKYIIKLIGEVDAYTAPDLREELIPLVEKGGDLITMDLSETEYMDSTGLGIIIAGLKAAKKSGSTLVVGKMTPRVERLFKITGLLDVLNNNNEAKEGKC